MSPQGSHTRRDLSCTILSSSDDKNPASGGPETIHVEPHSSPSLQGVADNYAFVHTSPLWHRLLFRAVQAAVAGVMALCLVYF